MKGTSRRWVIPAVVLASFVLLLGSAVAWADDSPDQQSTPADENTRSDSRHIQVLLQTLLDQSGEEFTVRIPPDGHSIEIRLSSEAQAQLAREVFSSLPTEVYTLVVGDDPNPSMPHSVDDFTYQFSPRPPFDFTCCPTITGLTSLSLATAGRVGPNWTQLTIILTVVIVTVAGGAVYWRRRIGLRTYLGTIALSVGLLVFLVSVLADFLLDGHPGFGVEQWVGIVLGVGVASAGVLALRGHGLPRRLRSSDSTHSQSAQRM